MKVKRYLASDVSEAMLRIRNELGRDAIILHTRKIRKKGFGGWFQKKIVEVVAAIDEPSLPLKKQPSVNEEEMQDALEAIKNLSTHMAENADQKDGNGNLSKNSLKNQSLKAKSDFDASRLDEENDNLATEVGALKKIVTELTDQVKALSPRHKISETPQAMPELEKETKRERTYQELLKEKLKNKNLSKEAVDLIFEKLDVPPQTLDDIFPAIQSILEPVKSINTKQNGQSIILFAGPTGVGKTTTLAKLAAKLSLIDGCSVGLITADTFRIAAVDQLRTYSEILGIPLTVIYEPEEVRGALSQYKDKDFILIDTAGRSHKSPELRPDLENLLRHVKQAEIFLVISLTTGYNDIISIIDAYGFLKEYKFIFTKLDEASSLTNILNAKAHCAFPLSYFTTGQNVPDDIEVASPEKVIHFIVED